MPDLSRLNLWSVEGRSRYMAFDRIRSATMLISVTLSLVLCGTHWLDCCYSLAWGVEVIVALVFLVSGSVARRIENTEERGIARRF